MVDSPQTEKGPGRRLALSTAILCLFFSVCSFAFAGAAAAQSDVVTTCGSSGAGSLPQVLATSGSGDTITFSVQCWQTNTITLTTSLSVNFNVDIEGPGAGVMVISGGNKVPVFTIAAGASAEISGVTVEDGSATNGGGIEDQGQLTLRNSVVSDSSATGSGGGIYDGASATITGSEIESNTATSGGGIFAPGMLDISDSTISGNDAPNGNGGGISSSGATSIDTSTISGNTSSYGGGVYTSEGAAYLTSSTVEGNRGGLYVSAGTISAAATVLADNAPGDDCTGAVSDGGFNADDDGSCGFSAAQNSLTDVDAELGPLMDNGGTTQTQAPASGSPVLERIPAGSTGNGTSLCPGTDQTGVSRPQGPECDIGAVELSANTGINSAPGATEPPNSFFSFTITTTGTTSPSLSENGSLPSTVTFVDDGDGTATLSGTPGTDGAYPIDVTATYGTGSATTVVTQAFTLVVSSAMTVVGQYSDRNCTGDTDTVAWLPSNVPNLTGYEIELFEQGDFENPPSALYFSVPADQTTMGFDLPYGFTSIFVMPFVFGDAQNGNVLEDTSVTGDGAPYQMNWTIQNSNVSSHSASVSFQWPGDLSQFQLTGGAPDTFSIVATPGGAHVDPHLSSDGVTVTGTFNGLNNGSRYTFVETTSNVCGSTPPSQKSATFQPGTAPTLSGSANLTLTKGKPYKYSFTRGGSPLPTVAVGTGKLPPGLRLSSTGALSGTPSAAGTFKTTLKASNGFGIGYPGYTTPASLSLTFHVKS